MGGLLRRQLRRFACVQGDVRAAQYGKSYLLMRPETRARCTITSRDSCRDDAVLGTLDHCAHVLLHVLQRCPAERGARRSLAEVLLRLGDPTQRGALDEIQAKVSALRSLALDYMELQIHGTVQFKRDVTFVVVAKNDVDRGCASWGGQMTPGTRTVRTYPNRTRALVL